MSWPAVNNERVDNECQATLHTENNLLPFGKGLSKQKERRCKLHKLPVFPGNSTGPIHLKAGLRPRSSVT